jgi:hypothetical protein
LPSAYLSPLKRQHPPNIISFHAPISAQVFSLHPNSSKFDPEETPHHFAADACASMRSIMIAARTSLDFGTYVPFHAESIPIFRATFVLSALDSGKHENTRGSVRLGRKRKGGVGHDVGSLRLLGV